MRVVGGRLRGRTIASPASREIRPTADRLRESLFNILVHAYGDPVTMRGCIDLFAGTGALGIEAISRGAAFCLFIDNGAEARALAAAERRGARPRRRHQGVPARRQRARQRASARAVHARLPRSTLRQGTCGEGARVIARRQLAWCRTSLVVVEESVSAKVAAPQGYEELERRAYDDTEFVVMRST